MACGLNTDLVVFSVSDCGIRVLINVHNKTLGPLINHK
jgi:hypothetical protein